ncbi:MAG: tripartite tricarboxylate transporter TctB family protein [Clostridia bacterium]|nr:tripartite tricarboxylate transporter TctB family protein [Clostridia bacterium]
MSFKKCRDLVLGVVMLALSVAYTVYARQIKTRPKLTPSYASARIIPTLLGVVLGVLSILLILQGIRKLRAAGEVQGEKMSRVDLLSVTLTFAAMVLYIVLLPNLGFILSTIIFLFLQITILAPTEKRNLLLFAVIAVVFTALVFVAFRIGLSQLLPRGPIEALLGF